MYSLIWYVLVQIPPLLLGLIAGKKIGWKIPVAVALVDTGLLTVAMFFLNFSSVSLFWASFILFLAMTFVLSLLFEEYDRRNFHRGVAYACVILALILAIAFVGASWLQGIGRANYFQNYMQEALNEPLFENEIQNNMVRLVTPELAKSIAEQHMSKFGSNMKIASEGDLGLYKGRLVWIEGISHQNTMMQNYIVGLILVDANDYTNVTVLDLRMQMAKGLFFTGNAGEALYWGDTTDYAYGDGNILFDSNGEPVYVQTRTMDDIVFVDKPAGPVIFDKYGSQIGKYERFLDTPSWISQPYDENWLERYINNWGDLRSGNTFDLFAGWNLWIFHTASTDRLKMSEDTRYVLDPDTNTIVAIVGVSPIAAENTLYGFFKADRNGVKFYDYHDQNLLSGPAAAAKLSSVLPAPSTGTLETQMPLLYGVKIGNEMVLTWFIPVYHVSEDSNIITVYALGMVDAKTGEFVLQEASGLSGQRLVSAVKNKFIRMMGGEVSVPEETIRLPPLRVKKVYRYDIDGNTVVTLRLEYLDPIQQLLLPPNYNISKYVSGTANDMPLESWTKLLEVKEGDTLTLDVQTMDNRLVIRSVRP